VENVACSSSLEICKRRRRFIQNASAAEYGFAAERAADGMGPR
jgi:hypothetical protein